MINTEPTPEGTVLLRSRYGRAVQVQNELSGHQPLAMDAVLSPLYRQGAFFAPPRDVDIGDLAVLQRDRVVPREPVSWVCGQHGISSIPRPSASSKDSPEIGRAHV